MFAKSDINIIEHYEIYFIFDQIQYFSALIFWIPFLWLNKTLVVKKHV